jgi:hypothetical protein
MINSGQIYFWMIENDFQKARFLNKAQPLLYTYSRLFVHLSHQFSKENILAMQNPLC